MPYESFHPSHHLQIRGLAQDRAAGGWRYVIHVRRALEPPAAKAPGAPAAAAEGGAHVYTIRRSLRDFRRLHEAMAPRMGRALPRLPVDSLLAFLVGETQPALLKKRAALERVLAAIDAHPAAADAPEYRAFLADADAGGQRSSSRSSSQHWQQQHLQPQPLSPAASSRSSFSCYSDDGLGLSSSATALRRAFSQQQRLQLQQHESAPDLVAAEARSLAADDWHARPRRRSLDSGSDAFDNAFEFAHFSST